jgi:hypothetical protein
LDVFKSSTIKFPETYDFSNYTEVSKHMTDSIPNKGLKKGVVFKNIDTNDRTKLINEEYTYVKNMKSNFSDMRFLYITLQRNGELNYYLHYFPEQYAMFNHYCQLVQDYTHCLFSLYRECYIYKTRPLNTYPGNYRTHMFKLHGIYQEKCRPYNTTLRLKDVISYVNNIDLPLLFTSVFIPVNEKKVSQKTETPPAVFAPASQMI